MHQDDCVESDYKPSFWSSSNFLLEFEICFYLYQSSCVYLFCIQKHKGSTKKQPGGNIYFAVAQLESEDSREFAVIQCLAPNSTTEPSVLFHFLQIAPSNLYL